MRRTRISLLLVLGMLAALLPMGAVAPAGAATTELFFSEYIEGSSNNKALEIYNGTGSAVDLAAGEYDVQMYFNGNSSAALTLTLSGTVADGDVYVVAHSSAVAAITDQADLTSGSGFFNGDDAVALRKGEVIVDVIGQIGYDPGSQWGTDLASTQDNTLRRAADICQGDLDGTDAFDPALEWVGFAKDTFDGLGSHTANCDGTDEAPRVISTSPAEDALDVALDANIEITFSEGVAVTDSWFAISCDGSPVTASASSGPASVFTLDPDANFANDQECMVTLTAASIADQDGDPDNLEANFSWSFETAPDVAPTVVSTVPADGDSDVALDSNIEITFSEAVTVTDPWFGISCNSAPVAATVTGGPSVFTLDPVGFAHDQECVVTLAATSVVDQDGDPDNLAADHSWSFTTPTITMIHDVQGNGFASPMDGQIVTIEGVVVGDFQGPDQIGGFHVQEEDLQIDGDLLTSEGVYVYAPNAIEVSIGDTVRVTGVVDEYYNLTQVKSFYSDAAELIGAVGPATPATVMLPVADQADFEAFEGMSVVFPQALYIAEYYNFARYGEIVLSSNRAMQPTAVFAPGSSEAIGLAADNALSRITLDDGRTNQNPDPAIHPNGAEFDLTNRFRGGDTITNMPGVMDYAYGNYKVQMIGGGVGGDYVAANPRPLAPAAVGGDVTVATFNVLNYFSTIDASDAQCYPSMTRSDCRGADSGSEFERQRTKIIKAIVVMDADVVGLMEIENNVADAAVTDLVEGLNDVAGAGTYAQVLAGQVGTDAIKVAIVYKPATVTPYLAHAVLDTPEFLDPANTGRDRNRAALAQSFIDNANGGVFTVVVNHLKSKGGSEIGEDDPDGDDPVGVCVDDIPDNEIPDCDQGDGQGYFNHTRTLAASVLADWIQTDPTGSGDADVLLIGDLNAYDKEGPIGVFDSRGYTDLVEKYGGEYAYSYVFDGQLGYLDYIMANGGMASQVTGTTVWHINTDEPNILDYDTSYKKPAQDALYERNAFRSSDHDPVIIGLNVCDEIAPTIDAITVSDDVLWPANHKYVDVTATVVASDNFDPNPTIELVSVVSSEPDNGVGDGNTVNDIDIVDDFTFKLRAERSAQGEGRIYTITYKVTDACGNESSGSTTVFVPLNRRGGR